uniref:Uncharacterized protein n=1 Tax=Arundo donax TaxID=35708 RepID=A0A0A9GUD6_ARUDO
MVRKRLQSSGNYRALMYAASSLTLIHIIGINCFGDVTSSSLSSCPC